jgi:hypothetical protein
MSSQESSLFQPIANMHKADVYRYIGNISDQPADQFVLTMKNRTERAKNCVVFIATFGGDASAAFRIARAMRRYYRGQVIMYILGQCKSAGTLLAVGADKIIMGDFGELGPIDVQLRKKDALFSRESGINHVECTKRLFEQLFTCFETAFVRLIASSSSGITTTTAADIASKISVGLFSPISSQIDPLTLADSYRSVMVAEDYGKRIAKLIPQGGKEKVINTLVNEYHAHDFVIDYEEARDIFGESSVALVSEECERAIETAYFLYWRYPIPRHQTVDIVACFSPQKSTQQSDDQSRDEGRSDGESEGRSNE